MVPFKLIPPDRQAPVEDGRPAQAHPAEDGQAPVDDGRPIQLAPSQTTSQLLEGISSVVPAPQYRLSIVQEKSSLIVPARPDKDVVGRDAREPEAFRALVIVELYGPVPRVAPRAIASVPGPGEAGEQEAALQSLAAGPAAEATASPRGRARSPGGLPLST